MGSTISIVTGIYDNTLVVPLDTTYILDEFSKKPELRSGFFIYTLSNLLYTFDMETTRTEIVYGDFEKVEIKIATILAVDEIVGADKLFKLTVDAGDLDAEGKPRNRTICAGVKEFFAPVDLIGKQVPIVANLVPRRMRGEISEGMILVAHASNGNPVLFSPTVAVPNGSAVR